MFFFMLLNGFSHEIKKISIKMDYKTFGVINSGLEGKALYLP